MAVIRNFRLPIGIGISADYIETFGVIQSLNPDLGAIVSRGGVGVGNSISIAGRLQMFNGSNFAAFYYAGSANTVYTLPATSPATGTSVLQSTSTGVMSWVPMTPVSVSSGTQYQIAGYYSGTAASVSGSTTFTNNTATGQVQILHTTVPSSTSNGALHVAGGVGISGRLFFNQASFGTTGIATNPTMAMIGNTGDPIYMSVLEDNSISFEGTQGQLFSITPNLSTGYIYSVNDITGIPLIRANANANVTANEYAGNFGIGATNPGYKLHVIGSVGFTSTTSSTSTSTGTLVVSGGVGIGQSLYTSTSHASSISGVVASNGIITNGSWAGSTITGFYGGTGYSSYTKGDLLVGVGSTLIKVGIGTSHQVLSYSPTAASGLGWTDLSISSPISTNYGAFYSTQTQPVLGANTITPVTVNNTYEAANIEIFGGAGTSSRIRILNGGVYNIQFSVQMNLSVGTQPAVADFWFRINGTDVPSSNSKQTIQGKDNQHILSLNFVSSFAAGQYFELMMNSPDQYFILEGTGSSTGPVRPATPSVIYTVTKVL